MNVSLSERRVSELIRQLEGIADNDSEISFRMSHYAGRLFSHLSDTYGLKFVGMIETHGDIGSFKFDITRCKDFHGTIDWDKLVGGLQFLNCLCLSVEPEDIRVICDALVGNSLLAVWPEYEATLQRITPSELQPRIESALMKFVWNRSTEIAATADGRHVHELQIQEAFGNAGLIDPSLSYTASLERRQREEAEYAKREQARIDRVWNNG